MKHGWTAWISCHTLFSKCKEIDWWIDIKNTMLFIYVKSLAIDILWRTSFRCQKVFTALLFFSNRNRVEMTECKSPPPQLSTMPLNGTHQQLNTTIWKFQLHCTLDNSFLSSHSLCDISLLYFTMQFYFTLLKT